MSTSEKVIQYTPQQLQQDFQQLLNNFLKEIQTEAIAQILGKALLQEFSISINQIQNKLNQNFSIAIAGDFKRGKSSLINALLQSNIVTTNVTPETVTINEIQYGTEFKINACLQDGGYIQLEPEELNAEKLLPILANYPNKISYLQIETPIDWLRGLRLIDTPGTGDIFKQFDKQVQSYLNQADVVVWVISVLSPLSESEQAFLRLSILPQDFPKLFFVINMIDVVRTNEDRERLLNTTREKINNIFPHAHVFAVSALDEICRIQSLPRPNQNLALTLENSFQSLRNCLQKSIVLNRDVILLERVTAQMSKLLQEFKSSINLLEEAIQTDQLSLQKAITHCEHYTSGLNTRIENHKQEMREEIAELCQQTHYWIHEFLERLVNEGIAHMSHSNLDDIRCHFHFFLTEKICQAIQQCLNNHQPAIIRSANKAKSSILEDFRQLNDLGITKINLAAPSTALDDVLWKNIDAVQLVIQLSPIGEIMRVVSNLLRQEQVNAEKSKYVGIYQQRLQEHFPKLQLALSQKIDEIYTCIATNIEQQIEQAYQQEREASLAAIKQAQQISISSEENLNITSEGVKVALSLVADTSSELKILKEKLESMAVLNHS
jgi:ribosome biogenesis GTPase A